MLLSLFSGYNSYGQKLQITDSSAYVVKKDSTKIILHSPKKAAIYSAVMPGLGQIYNKKYWKVPIVYAALATTIYFVKYNTDKYTLFHQGYVAVSNKVPQDDPFDGKYDASQLNNAAEFYRRNRDLSYFFTILFYAMNIIDANVDAHLYYFNISDDIALKLQPKLFYNTFSSSQSNQTFGLSLSLHFNH